jgi:hypothetical protein
VRVGDRVHERVVELLRHHAAEGRLEPKEREARIDAAYAARTQADLEPLTRDLPAPRSETSCPRRLAAVRPAIVRWAVVNVAVLAV